MNIQSALYHVGKIILSPTEQLVVKHLCQVSLEHCYSLHLDVLPKPHELIGGALWRSLDLGDMVLVSGVVYC